MNRTIRVILMITLLIVCLVSAYEFLCIYELTADVTELSNNIKELEKDSRSSHGDIQEMKNELKTVNRTLDIILRELWLSRPPVPEDYLPMPVKEE